MIKLILCFSFLTRKTQKSQKKNLERENQFFDLIITLISITVTRSGFLLIT